MMMKAARWGTFLPHPRVFIDQKYFRSLNITHSLTFRRDKLLEFQIATIGDETFLFFPIVGRWYGMVNIWLGKRETLDVTRRKGILRSIGRTEWHKSGPHIPGYPYGPFIPKRQTMIYGKVLIVFGFLYTLKPVNLIVSRHRIAYTYCGKLFSINFIHFVQLYDIELDYR